MKRWQIVFIAALGLALAQAPLQYQNWFTPKITESQLLQPLLEPFLPVQEKTYSLWYGFIPDQDFSMQFADIPDRTMYFIYPETPRFELPKLEDIEILPSPEQP
jgi:hypothetical protein